MTLPRPVALACELARLGATVVVVGGTARLLRDGAHDPADLDVVVPDAAVPSLVSALEALGCTTTRRRLVVGRCVRVDTAWGPLDVFVGDLPPSREIPVGGIGIQVAA
jgi:hypothetical protein